MNRALTVNEPGSGERSAAVGRQQRLQRKRPPRPILVAMKTLRASLLAGLAMYVAFFAVLATDLVYRIWLSRAGFESVTDVALLIQLEAVRAVVTVCMVCIAIGVSRRAEPGHFALAFALLWFALWYAKASSFAAFPGYLQQRIAIGLTDAGVSRRLLLLLFGQPTWALAPAIASFLAFSLRYPGKPRPEQVRAVHATGRRGMLRGTAVAGTDIRSFVHRLAARALDAGMLRDGSLYALGIGGALLLAFGGRAGALIVLPVLAMAGAFAVAYLRSAHLSIAGPHRRALRRLGMAGISLAIEFVLGGALSLLPGGALAHVALAFAAAAPLCAIIFLFGFALAARTEERLVAEAV